MRGRHPGKPTKRVYANLFQNVEIRRAGVRFQIWRKWKQKDKLLGTLIVSVGGMRWRPANGKYQRWRDWDEVAAWLTDGSRGSVAPR